MTGALLATDESGSPGICVYPAYRRTLGLDIGVTISEEPPLY